MHLSGWENAEDDFMLPDSGATHALRPAKDDQEWQLGLTTTVQLAEDSTDQFRLKKGTKILLSSPATTNARIIPMGGLADLDFSLEWTGSQCRFKDDEGREIPGSSKWVPYGITRRRPKVDALA